MKTRNLLLITLGFTLLITGCHTERTIENPYMGASNNTTIDIERILISDTCTSVHLAFAISRETKFAISQSSHIIYDGKSYGISDTSCALPVVLSPESSRMVIDFKPVPLSAGSIDLIVETDKQKYIICDIKTSPGSSFLKENVLSKEHMKEIPYVELPDFVFKPDTTCIYVHVPEKTEGVYRSLSITMNCLFNGLSMHEISIDPDTNTGVLKFEQLTTTAGVIKDKKGIIFGEFVAEPGETMHIWCNAGAINQIMENKLNNTSIPVRRCFFEGTYENLNNLLTHEVNSQYSLRIFDLDFVDYRMSTDEFVEYLIACWKNKNRLISDSELHPILKGYLSAKLTLAAVNAMYFYCVLADSNYRMVNNIRFDAPIPYKPAMLTASQCSKVLDNLNLDSKELWMTYNSDVIQKISIICPTYESPERIRNYTRGLFMYISSQTGQLSTEMLDELKDIENGFYYELCDRTIKKAIESSKAADKFIQTTPDVPASELFDSIISKYHDKNIIVDFWNTWCGPCRAAIKKTEPLKAEELSGDNLIWIYIANESSPIDDYEEIASNIKGQHYRLTENQWDTVCNQLGIDSIPAYVIVDKEGKYELRNDLRKHDTFVKEIKNLL